MIGIHIKPTIGIGDGLQYSSLPENYFRATGQKLVDLDRPWFFDDNPYVIRDENAVVDKKIQMWNFPNQYPWPKMPAHKPQVYRSNAEIWAKVFDVEAVLTRPRLYRFESFPFEQRQLILFQTQGISHGKMPEHIVKHVIEKYSATDRLYHLAAPGDTEDLGIPKIMPANLWDLAEVISKSRMLIGPDSGPSWIAACYPDVISKKVRTKPTAEHFAEWVPLEVANIHAHWDSREHMVFNPSEDDIGFTWSYRKI